MLPTELEYITWFDNAHWASDIILGTDKVRYNFKADWNNRNSSWAITIKLNNKVILQGVQLVLNVNLLAMCYCPTRPNCILYAATDNHNIDRISYENMINGDVKLYHIIPKGLNA